jgi:uncharacterized Zn finger protein
MPAMAWYRDDFQFPQYVSVATRKARARKAAEKLARKRGRTFAPVGPINGTKIARTFWGKSWCQNLESYSDYANRLPRGRTYVRHGAVIDLQIAAGKITALVSGTETYEITVTISALEPRRWKEIAAACTGKIDSLIDLLKGNLSQPVMEIVTRKERGLFPMPGQIGLQCSCPDWAGLCKHVAAVLYGVGVRLDDQPELLFTLRGVDHLDLISGAAEGAARRRAPSSRKRKVIEGADLSSLFGIEIEGAKRPKPRRR